jgi:hypothetical protein
MSFSIRHETFQRFRPERGECRLGLAPVAEKRSPVCICEAFAFQERVESGVAGHGRA